jgi:hypothetical protein
MQVLIHFYCLCKATYHHAYLGFVPQLGPPPLSPILTSLTHVCSIRPIEPSDKLLLWIMDHGLKLPHIPTTEHFCLFTKPELQFFGSLFIDLTTVYVLLKT